MNLRYYLAEVVDAGISFLCVLSGHFYGCLVMNKLLSKPFNWSINVLTDEKLRYVSEPHKCPYCDAPYRGTVPNPYYATEAELATWARWYGSNVTPEDYQNFLNEK